MTMMMSVPSTKLTFPCRRGDNGVRDASSLSKRKKNRLKPTQALTLIGRSRAGDGTAFLVPELGWMLDCGALIDTAGGRYDPRILLLTHTHSDHVQCLATLIYRLCWEHKYLDVYLPAASIPLVRAYLRSYRQMIEGNRDASKGTPSKGEEQENVNSNCPKRSISPTTTICEQQYQLQPTNAGSEFTVHSKGRDYVIRTYECHHRIVCHGYGVFKVRHKLKQE